MYKYIADTLNEILCDLEQMNEDVENISAVDEVEYKEMMTEKEYDKYAKLCEKGTGELRPCPFCGGNAIINHRYALLGGDRVQIWVHWMQCSKCGCETSISSMLEETIASWNVRGGRWQ